MMQSTLKSQLHSLYHSQYQRLLADISVIETEFEQYLSGFMKAAKKNRIAREPLYRESSLVNFLGELGKSEHNTHES